LRARLLILLGLAAIGFAVVTHALAATVTGIDPTHGPAAGGNTVTITGSDFGDSATVEFGPNSATDVVVVDDTTITATAPAGTAGTPVDVTVNPAQGPTDTLPDAYTYDVPPPMVTSLSPDHGPAAGGNQVTITGTNLNGTTQVQFGANNATNVNVVDDTTITANAPGGTAGQTVDVTVTTPGGTSPTAGAGNDYSYDPLPVVNNLIPDHGPAAGGNQVTIFGTHLAGATQVSFGGNNASSNFGNDTSISVTAPQGTPGSVDVSVTTPSGTSANTPADDYTYDQPPPPPAPTVTDVVPNHGPAAGGNQVTIFGTNFTGATEVHFGTADASTFTVNNSSRITATAPGGTAGQTVNVSVTTSGGTSSTAGTDDDYAYDVPPPAVTSLNPNHGPAAGGTSVTITGTNLSGATAVQFGGTNATSFTVDNATHITATSPGGTAGQTVDVTVTTPGGTSPTGGAGNNYSYDPLPTVTALNPTHGLAAGGNQVTITGTNFSGATAVHFGANNATNVQVNGAGTQITATAPGGTAGQTVDVTMTTPAGTSSTAGTANDYTYDALPVVTDLSPAGGPAAGGTSVTIIGANFTGATAVHFGANNATNVVVHASNTITATAPAGAPGSTVQVTVTTPAGTSSTAGTANDYTYNPLMGPAVDDLFPSHGPAGGGNQVTIIGNNFSNATAVRFGPNMATSISVVNPTKITANAPAGLAGTTVDVTVSTPGGTSPTAGAGNDYTYDPAPPPAAAPTPASAPIAPNTFLNRHPPHRTHKRKVTFRFSSNMSSAKFRCLYAQGWQPCRSPHTFRHLKPGRYRFQAQAVVNGVPDPTPASWTFRVLRASD
jgi:IPT/TIG domain